jgi:hypothetical protein
MRMIRWPAGVRLRSAVAAAVVVGVAVAVAAVIFIASARVTLTRNVENAAVQRSDEVTAALRSGDDLEDALRPGTRGAVQVLTPDGAVVTSSAGAPDAPLTTLRPVAGGQAWEDRTIGDGPFRVLARGVATGDGTRVVVVAQSLLPVVESAEALTQTLTWGMPALVVIVGLAVFVFVGRSLRPVEAGRHDQRPGPAVPGPGAGHRRRGRGAGRDDERDARPAGGRGGRPAAVRRRRESRAAQSAHHRPGRPGPPGPDRRDQWSAAGPPAGRSQPAR